MEPPSGYGYKVESIKEDASPATGKGLIETFRRYSELNGGVSGHAGLWAMSRFAEKHHPKRSREFRTN